MVTSDFSFREENYEDSDIPLSYFFVDYVFERNLWNYYQQSLRTSRKILLHETVNDNYYLFVMYPFGWSLDAICENGTSWNPVKVYGPVQNIYSFSAALKHAEPVVVHGTDLLGDFQKTLGRYYEDSFGIVRYGLSYDNSPTQYKGQLDYVYVNALGLDAKQTAQRMFDQCRTYIQRAYKETGVMPVLPVSFADESFSEQSWGEIVDVYTGYIDNLGIYVPIKLKINPFYTSFYYDKLEKHVSEDEGQRDYVVCDVVGFDSEEKAWLAEQDLVEYGFMGIGNVSIGEVMMEIADSTKIILPRVRAFGRQKDKVVEYEKLVKDWMSTKYYDDWLSYQGSDTAEGDTELFQDPVKWFNEQSVGNRIFLAIITAGISEVLGVIGNVVTGSGTTDNVVQNILTGTSPVFITACPREVYDGLVTKLKGAGVLDKEGNPIDEEEVI